MTEKRFEINNLVKKGNMSFWDNENKSILNSSHTLDLLNSLSEENEHLKKLLKCSREEANDYCEELMGKDEFIRLYKRIVDELEEENEKLKSENKDMRVLINNISDQRDEFHRGARENANRVERLKKELGRND